MLQVLFIAIGAVVLGAGVMTIVKKKVNNLKDQDNLDFHADEIDVTVVPLYKGII